MTRLTPEEIRHVHRIFYHLFELRSHQLPYLEEHSVFCVELPISFRGYVITATFTGENPHLMLGVGREFVDKANFSYSGYSHMALGAGSFYRHVDGTFLSPEYTPFQLKYAPLHSRNHPKVPQHYVNCFLEMHDSYSHGEFRFYLESFPAFFGMFDNTSSPKLSL